MYFNSFQVFQFQTLHKNVVLHLEVIVILRKLIRVFRLRYFDVFKCSGFKFSSVSFWATDLESFRLIKLPSMS